jgi:hypothetical protein
MQTSFTFDRHSSQRCNPLLRRPPGWPERLKESTIHTLSTAATLLSKAKKSSPNDTHWGVSRRHVGASDERYNAFAINCLDVQWGVVFACRTTLEPRTIRDVGNPMDRTCTGSTRFPFPCPAPRARAGCGGTRLARWHVRRTSVPRSAVRRGFFALLSLQPGSVPAPGARSQRGGSDP